MKGQFWKEVDLLGHFIKGQNRRDIPTEDEIMGTFREGRYQKDIVACISRCPVEFLEFTDDAGRNMRVSCFFPSGEHKGKSKGLFILAKELNIMVPDSIKLDALKEIMSKHRAFQSVCITY